MISYHWMILLLNPIYRWSLYTLLLSSPKMESLNDLIFEGEMASAFWAHFNGIFEMPTYGHATIYHCLGEWFSYGSPYSLERFLYSILPLIFQWEIWKERCHQRFKGDHRVAIRSTKVIFFISDTISKFYHIFSTPKEALLSLFDQRLISWVYFKKIPFRLSPRLFCLIGSS